MATNREIFMEAFGYEPGGCPFYCSDVIPCPFEELDRSCRTHEFWDMDNKVWKQYFGGKNEENIMQTDRRS